MCPAISHICRKLYTGEDFVNLLNGTPRRGVISNRYRYRSLGELKCPIQQVYEFFNGVNAFITDS